MKPREVVIFIRVAPSLEAQATVAEPAAGNYVLELPRQAALALGTSRRQSGARRTAQMAGVNRLLSGRAHRPCHTA